jgi:hypothetical protein
VSNNPLSRVEFHALNALADGIEPLEFVLGSLEGEGIKLSRDEFLALMFGLFRRGYITISQAPIPSFGQEFSERAITPASPEDLAGDLKVPFQETYAHGGYLRSAATPANTPPAGIPFGIYFDLTPAGRAEWDLPQYEVFVEERSV